MCENEICKLNLTSKRRPSPLSRRHAAAVRRAAETNGWIRYSYAIPIHQRQREWPRGIEPGCQIARSSVLTTMQHCTCTNKAPNHLQQNDHRTVIHLNKKPSNWLGRAKCRATKIGPKADEAAFFAVFLRTSINADRKKLVTSYQAWL